MRRLPLGIPSRLRQRALALADGLIRSPGSSRPDGQGSQREAGYIILGALCASGLPSSLKVTALHTSTTDRAYQQYAEGPSAA